MATYRKNKAAAKPEGMVRQSQMVTTYGPGSMMDLVDQAVLIGGLDFWSYDKHKERPVIHEPRLRERIAAQFREANIALSEDAAFRTAPAGDDRDPSRYVGVRVLEFPQWFVCQNPKCRALVGRKGLTEKGSRHLHDCGLGGKPSETVPMRFLGACRRGHVQDIDWVYFAHRGPRCGAPRLRFNEGVAGDFSEITVECTSCKASQKLIAARSHFKLKCGGHRPWLGPDAREECEEELRLLVRTASNSYFSQVVSALSIPDPSRELHDAVESQWSILKAASTETLPSFRHIPSVDVAIKGYSDEEVLHAVQAKLADKPTNREAIRTAEFKRFINEPMEAHEGELAPDDVEFFARGVSTAGLPPQVERLVIAPKLREVRAQIGFTRLEPVTPDLQGEFDIGVESARLGLSTDWLPATEIRGEGVFLQFKESAIQEWENRPAVRERAKELEAGYDAWGKTVSNPPPFPGARFYMIHSLSHLLISAISLACGYSASAIRERLYCGPSERDPNTPRAAILLSTGSSGSEGTLGGLVEEGRKLGEYLRQAWDLGRLCSNDPVCAGHSPQDDPAERHLEGAACHGCLFIAEPSCERFNRYLDRALVVPTVGRDPELAFFSERPNDQ